MAFIKSCSIDSRNEQSPTWEVVHETNKAHLIPAQQISCLAQLVEHWCHNLEVLVSIPTLGANFDIFFCSSLCKDLSDNLTETPIVKNEWVSSPFITDSMISFATFSVSVSVLISMNTITSYFNYVRQSTSHNIPETIIANKQAVHKLSLSLK